jgi:hypothetical protein
MDDQILTDLSSEIDPGIAKDLLNSYINLVTRFRKGDLDGCLSASGKFVENSLRAIEFLRTGKVLAEIKNASRTKTAIENDPSLSEPLRILVPRIALAMVYDVRSKTGAVHVKEIDPRPIDASLAVHAASWVVAEFLRLHHVANEADVEAAMSSLMRTYIPYIESFGGEEVVTRQVKCELELLLLLANGGANGLTRKEIGVSSKYKPSTITNTLGNLADNRYLYQTADRRYHITGPGEHQASQLLTESTE